MLLVALLSAFPWLSPVVAGPSPSVLPWLVSAGCGVGLWFMAGSASAPRGLVIACAAMVTWAVLAHLPLRPEMAMLSGGLALLVLGAAAAQDRTTAPALQGGLLVAAAINAVTGLVQYMGMAHLLAPVVSPAEAGMAYGNLRQTNQYASFCWIGVALVLWGKVRLPRGSRIALTSLLALAAAASVSRTGMLQGGLLLSLALLWGGSERRERVVLCGVATFSYFAGALLLPLLLETVAGQAPLRTLWGRLGSADGCASRLVLWSNVLHLIAQTPLTGWGWGELDYAHYMTLYEGTRFCEILDNAHNLPLHLAVELGVPAALLVVGGAAFWAWRQRPWEEHAPLRQLAWAILGLILLHSLLEYPLWYGPFQMALGFCLGWLLARQDAPQPPVSKLGRTAVAAALVATVAYAAWDYARVSQVYLPPEERHGPWAEDTLGHVRRSWLFSGQARFADFTLATPDRNNALWMYTLGEEALHYSPEPRVIERVIESAVLAGREDEALMYLVRFRAAFPTEYEAWRQAHRRLLRR